MSVESRVKDCQVINLPEFADGMGMVSGLNGNSEIPFEIKRVFYLYDISVKESRGAHAHKTCHQFLIAVKGSFEVLLDDGINKRLVLLDSPNVGLHILPGIWDSQLNFSPGAICLVIASTTYLEEDYIRNYDNFLKYKGDK